jgi:hypothetical protein
MATTVLEGNSAGFVPGDPLDIIKWTTAMETALLKMARQAQFDFEKVAKGLRAAVLRGLVRPVFRLVPDPASVCGSVFIFLCQVACDAPVETAELLTVKACRLKFAALDRVMKAAAKAVVAATPVLTIPVLDSNAIRPPEVPALRDAGEISENAPSSVARVLMARADAVSTAGRSVSAFPVVQRHERYCEPGQCPAAIEPPPDGGEAPAASSVHVPYSPTTKPIAELLTCFEAPLFRNYVKAPRLPTMTVY